MNEEEVIELYKKQTEESKKEDYIRPITYLQQDVFTEEICYEAILRCINKKIKEVQIYKPYKKMKTLSEIKEQLDLDYENGLSWVYRWIDETRTYLVVIQTGRFLRVRANDTEQIIEAMIERLEVSEVYAPLLLRFVYEPSKKIPDRKLITTYYWWEQKPVNKNEKEVQTEI